MSSKIHFSLLEKELVVRPGYEYLVLLRSESRSRAMESLGRFPIGADLRDYVRMSPEDVLSEYGCRENAVVMVGDYVVLTPRSPVNHPDDLWQFWVELFFLPHDMLEEDEYEMLSCAFGDTRGRELGLSHRGQYSATLQTYVDKKLEFTETPVLESQKVGDADVQEKVCELILGEMDISVDQFQRDVAINRSTPLQVGNDAVEGYCYDRVFPAHFRSMVRVMLGPRPDLHRVIDLMLVFRHYDLFSVYDPGSCLRQISDGVLHIDKGGSNSYAILHDLVEHYVHGFRGCVGAQVADVADTPRGKVFCDVCQCIVNPLDHAMRCRPKDAVDDHRYKILLRRRAWQGDNRQRSDVCQIIMCLDIVPELYQAEAQKYTDGKKQAAWYRLYDGYKYPSLGTSDAALSTAFEASYVGQFRDDYVRYVLSQYSKVQFPRELLDMIVDDTSKLVLPLQMSGLMKAESGVLV